MDQSQAGNGQSDARSFEIKVGLAEMLKGGVIMDVTTPEQAKIAEAFAKNDNIALHTYAGVDHAFAREGGQNYDKAAADLANQRTLDFFKEQLS